MHNKKPENEDMPTYDAPLPQRYNPYGEWRPLLTVSGLTPEDIDERVNNLTDEVTDQRIKAVVKYVLATNCPTIEFIIKTDFLLPYPDFGFQHEIGHFHMRPVQLAGENNFSANLQVYDASLGLTMDPAEIDIEKIKEGLNLIEVFLNRLAFALDSKVEWVLKYNYSSDLGGIKQVSVDDLQIVQEHISSFQGEDSSILDAVIAWYLNGKKSNNSFIKYLNYYIALEGLSLHLADGNMEACDTYSLRRETKSERKTEREQCIQELLKVKKLNPETEEYIREAHGKCILGNYQKTLSVLESVFGLEDTRLELFKKKIDKENLYTLRSKLAHGKFTQLDEEHREMVEERLSDLDFLVKELANMALYRIEKGGKYPKVNPSRTASIVMADPRSCGIATSPSMFPHNDWRIRLEWLF